MQCVNHVTGLLCYLCARPVPKVRSIAVAVLPTRGFVRRWLMRRQLKKVLKKFRGWAARCPDNFLAKERLLAAEVARLAGQETEAVEAYRAAIAAAERYGYRQIEALANERLAGLHRERARSQEAAAARSAAAAAYRQWGAEALAGRCN